MINKEKFFCYNPFDNEFETFETREEAEDCANELIQYAKSYDKEWPTVLMTYMETEYIYTGVIEKCSVFVHGEDEDGNCSSSDGVEYYDVEMKEMV